MLFGLLWYKKHCQRHNGPEGRKEALTSISQTNISISAKFKIKILTKHSFMIQLRYLNQTSAANFKILTKPLAQNPN